MDDVPRSTLRFRAPTEDDATALAALGLAGLAGIAATLVGVGPDDRVVAASAVQATQVAMVGDQLLELYAAVPQGLAAADADALLSATYDVLDTAFDHEDASAPIGLCLLIADRAELRRRPEAHWEHPPALYVGYLGDRRQVRVAYFEGALLRRATA